MADAQDIADAADQAATEPLEFEDADGSRVKGHNLKELIAYQKYKAATEAISVNPFGALRQSSINRPGPTE